MRRAHSRRSNASSEGVGTSLPTSRLPLRHGCRIADETRFGRPRPVGEPRPGRRRSPVAAGVGR